MYRTPTERTQGKLKKQNKTKQNKKKTKDKTGRREFS